MVHTFLPCDAGCAFVSVPGSLHNATGLAAFLSAVAGIGLIARRLAVDPDWQSYRAYSVFTAIAGLLSLVLWIALGKAARIAVFNGSLQRVFIAVIFLWVEVMAIRLFSLTKPRPL